MKLSILLEEKDEDIGSVVGIVKYKGKYLLGLSLSSDDRKGTWCFPGGHRKRGESIEKGVEREVREETNVRCDHEKSLRYDNKKGVKFCVCKASGCQKLIPNNEFAALGFFSKQEMGSIKLYHNVKELIAKA